LLRIGYEKRPADILSLCELRTERSKFLFSQQHCERRLLRNEPGLGTLAFLSRTDTAGDDPENRQDRFERIPARNRGGIQKLQSEILQIFFEAIFQLQFLAVAAL